MANADYFYNTNHYTMLKRCRRWLILPTLLYFFHPVWRSSITGVTINVTAGTTGGFNYKVVRMK